jgi:hypothetical protein
MGAEQKQYGRALLTSGAGTRDLRAFPCDLACKCLVRTERVEALPDHYRLVLDSQARARTHGTRAGPPPVRLAPSRPSRSRAAQVRFATAASEAAGFVSPLAFDLNDDPEAGGITTLLWRMRNGRKTASTSRSGTPSAPRRPARQPRSRPPSACGSRVRRRVQRRPLRSETTLRWRGSATPNRNGGVPRLPLPRRTRTNYGII